MDNLIIGGNGYVGSALYNVLDADSIDLCLFGNDLGYSLKENYNNIDISKYKNIILLAGHSSVKMCEYNKKNAWINNVDYFYYLCENLKEDQLLIYASSASVYGVSDGLCYEDNINLNPINCYDLTKVSIDIIANKFISEGKKIIGLRFGTVNGNAPNIRSDLMINAMVYFARTRGYIELFNAGIKRPILGIEDLINCIQKIIKLDTIHSGQYNLCSFNSTVLEIGEAVSKILDCPIKNNSNTDKVYDFEISSKKIEETYNFTLQQDIFSIVSSMIDVNTESFSSRLDDKLIKLHN